MNPEEVIERLKTIFAFGISNCIADKIARDTTFAALEKQIPTKPQLESDGYSDSELVYDTWICPKCGEDYEIDCHDYKYCPECGQRIDRGEIE